MKKSAEAESDDGNGDDDKDDTQPATAAEQKNVAHQLKLRGYEIETRVKAKGAPKKRGVPTESVDETIWAIEEINDTGFVILSGSTDTDNVKTLVKKVAADDLIKDYVTVNLKVSTVVSKWSGKGLLSHTMFKIDTEKGNILNAIGMLHTEFEANHHDVLDVSPQDGVRVGASFEKGKLVLVPCSLKVNHAAPTDKIPSGAVVVGESSDVRFYVSPCKRATSEKNAIVVPYWYVPNAAEQSTTWRSALRSSKSPSAAMETAPILCNGSRRPRSLA
jgi:hypothetical protein